MNPVPEPQTPPATGGDRWGRIPAWWLDHPDLDADGLAVLAALSTYADDSGVCWPSQATLAGKLKRSRPTVNRLLGRLVALGLVTIERRSATNGGRLTCRYRLRFTRSVEAAEDRTLDGDSGMDSPRPAASHKQPEPEQILDTLDRRASGTQPAGPRPVPDDWQPSVSDRLWAEQRFPQADLTRHAERFVQQCRAHGYRYRDAGAAWRSWLLQDATREQPTSASQPPDCPETRSRARVWRKPDQRQAEAEQRVSAWAAVAARLNGPTGGTDTPWSRA